MVSFKRTPQESEIIRKIVARYRALCITNGFAAPDVMCLTMDISACHANGNPLRLDDLLGADEFNFVHDVGGIHCNIDRDTGKLTNCFVPRYTYHEPAI